jgi:hypothetical protein
MASHPWSDEQRAKFTATMKAKRRPKRKKKLTPVKRALKAARFRATMAAKRASRAEANADFNSRDEIHGRSTDTISELLEARNNKRKLEMIRQILDL